MDFSLKRMVSQTSENDDIETNINCENCENTALMSRREEPTLEQSQGIRLEDLQKQSSKTDKMGHNIQSTPKDNGHDENSDGDTKVNLPNCLVCDSSAITDDEHVNKNSDGDTKVDIQDCLVSSSTVNTVSSYTKQTTWTCKSLCCIFLIFGVIAVLILMLTFFLCYNSTMVPQLVSHERGNSGIPRADASYEGQSSEAAYAQFHLNQTALTNEKRICWIQDQMAKSITADNNGCIAVSIPGLYIAISKVTFAINFDDTGMQAFHNIILNKQDEGGELLEKNVFSLLKPEYPQVRTLWPSTITLSRMLKADDSLCVAVDDVKRIHVSPTDNTFNIFKL